MAGVGVTCIRAESGKEALDRLLPQLFAVIVLDVSMPVMDGFETARLMRDRKTDSRPSALRTHTDHLRHRHQRQPDRYPQGIRGGCDRLHRRPYRARDPAQQGRVIGQDWGTVRGTVNFAPSE